MELQQIAADVYACLQEDRGLGTSNSGLVNRGGGMVVDTLWDLPHTREMIGLYDRVWSQPARRVVNTHENGDHCWGNQLFPDAEIIASQACADAFGDGESPAILQSVKGQAGNESSTLASFARRLADWDFSDIELHPPTTTFETRLDLDLDGVEAQLIRVGPAHTAGDSIVHLPEAGVVFAGDVIFRLCTPIGWAGTFSGWAAALDRIVALAPSVIVPGHGPLCGVEGAVEMRAYLEYVQSESRRFFEAGLPALEAAKKIDLGPYADWTEPERLVFNVERAYREFRGVPWDAPLDRAALFSDVGELSRFHRGQG